MIAMNLAVAQGNYQQQYTNAKTLFREGKYNLAMEAFKGLIVYDKENPFSEYASYYYAVCAYRQNYPAVARDMFVQLKKLYPAWRQLDEVNLWLAHLHFANRDYFQGLRVLAEIKNMQNQAVADNMKRTALAGINDVETLKMMHENYPQDVPVASTLAREIAAHRSNPEDQKLLEQLVKTFKFNASDYQSKGLPVVHKPVYSVSLLFPFLTSTLEPTPGRKRNQFILELYEGMKMAADTLEKQGIHISLRAYDTERNPEKIRGLLKLEELKTTDLIVGPFFAEENAPVQEFSSRNRINLFNPVSNNAELIGANPFGFLYMPSWETLGSASAEFLTGYAKNRKCMVVMGETRSDSVLAMNFLKKAAETELEIIQIEKVSRTTSGRILSILATPTEFDEFKYPIQFTLPKDSLGCVFVASEDPLIYTKVISSIETRKDSTVIVGSEKWLDQAAVDFEKYQNLGVVLFAPMYTNSTLPAYLDFQRKFIRWHGRVSSGNAYTDFTRLGYDFLWFAGKALHEYGVYFQEGMQKVTAQPGHLLQGYRLGDNRNNQWVPMVKFSEGQLVIVE
jgi:hypothetical protein